MDGDSGSSALGQAGYAITGSGGGGGGGQYVFANLEELDGIIAEWEALYLRIKDRGDKLKRAIDLIEPPARDTMSRLQAKAAVASLRKAETHRQAMQDYARHYVDKLLVARERYATTDADNAARLRDIGED